MRDDHRGSRVSLLADRLLERYATEVRHAEAPGAAELSAWLAGRPELASMPVVLMTAFPLRQLPSTISGALHKPFDLDELLTLVATLIE